MDVQRFGGHGFLVLPGRTKEWNAHVVVDGEAPHLLHVAIFPREMRIEQTRAFEMTMSTQDSQIRLFIQTHTRLKYYKIEINGSRYLNILIKVVGSQKYIYRTIDST